MKNTAQQYAKDYANDIYPPSFFIGAFGYLATVALLGHEFIWNDAWVAFVIGGAFGALAYFGGYHFALIALPWLERGVVTESHATTQSAGYEQAESPQPETVIQESAVRAEPMTSEPLYNHRHLSLFLKAIDEGDIKVGETVTLAKLNTANISRFDNRGSDSSATKFLDFLRRVGVVNGEDTLTRQPPPPRQMDTPPPF